MILGKRKERQTQAVSSKKIPNAPIPHDKGWSSLLWQWFRYCLVGVTNTLIDVLVLSILLWCFPTDQVQILVVYNSLAYLSGATSSFFLNKYWTFGRQQRPTLQEVSRFLLSLLLEILSSNGLLWLIGTALHPLLVNALLWGTATKLLTVAANTVLSYLIMRCWIFRDRSSRRLKPQATVHSALARSPSDARPPERCN
ncbi:hypothetical protein KSC_110760 [Ktedonobacter sp. SOSP1-52]|uniref:GtrA family protein n=1 Tax=Ktedonobacter sp. SOSP1-52 TaxID=2778366 RepID=UPI00191632E3|nr:GtrA family protein [Ktedonobacter sp. SOSP1-52]GHO72184.1 hypothetical protein KSC_110760 [Ktedonobacter sp. SOSP1-52]